MLNNIKKYWKYALAATAGLIALLFLTMRKSNTTIDDGGARASIGDLRNDEFNEAAAEYEDSEAAVVEAVEIADTMNDNADDAAADADAYETDADFIKYINRD